MKVYNALGQLQVSQYDGVIQNAKRTIFLSLAGGWTGTTLPDGGVTKVETSTNKINYNGTKFVAAATASNHEFGVCMPDNYNGGTITAIPYFYTASTDASSHIIIFGLQGVALADGDLLDVSAYGTLVTSSTTVASSIANQLKKGTTTGAITIANSPSAGKWVQFRVTRNGSGSSPADTFTGDVVLLGIKIIYTTKSYSDA